MRRFSGDEVRDAHTIYTFDPYTKNAVNCQFAFQAPGSDEKIDSFCKMRYDTKFPQFSKIKVNGKEADPLYVYLKSQKPGRITWNFAKFLIDKNGNVAGRFAPSEKPNTLEGAIEAELRK
ncbi:MAG: hypothetical protein IJW67_06125 [Blautia sp.]|nr:hypothetical protein [Blautia sp.]